MTTSLTLWLLSAIIPLVMATYIFGHDNNGDIVRDLVQQVRDLQITVNQQGKRIEDLERRLKLALKETFDETETMSQTSKTVLRRTGSDTGTDSGFHPPNSVNRQTENSTGRYNSNKQMISSDKRESSTNGKLRRGIRSATTVAFSVYMNYLLEHVSVGHALRFNGVLYNDGNHFNTHTGGFTAPLTGVYMFIYFIDDADDGNSLGVRLVVNGVHEVDALARPVKTGVDVMGGNSAILPVNAGQTVWLQTATWDNADLFSSGNSRLVTFSGFLIN